ncbi:HAD family hydrolase [Roseibium denhamense]|uniref:Haloacid dehalogenase superfamily, subfamily IA, variant 3 with third motif having DD or ED n=1 Tax=Roseibium denhamense TaxID=76305 RepID=A0ABY1PLX9_9HYPH|nr:HAD-IA family hydrolase [Roseibium denhamense]MTI04218.1 HAD family hydrolase [Roseibium denhamense]SMP36873.1 haloacid dehalogenase superfamily, subfamily IA, variant 3 with third motif having DD or ED [Roseibium denhamense]
MTYPKAVLFGSIGTLAETSELQRQAFNQAFIAHGLDWVWDQPLYQALLRTPGGINRIEAFARAEMIAVDAKAIHASKTRIYHLLLDGDVLAPRDGVAETLAWARQMGIRTGLVSTTSRANIDQLLDALAPMIGAADFDIICDASNITAVKPAPDVYQYALTKLGLSAMEAVAIEDTEASLTAAVSAGLPAIAFPGENAAGDDFSTASLTVHNISAEAVSRACSLQMAAEVA